MCVVLAKNGLVAGLLMGGVTCVCIIQGLYTLHIATMSARSSTISFNNDNNCLLFLENRFYYIKINTCKKNNAHNYIHKPKPEAIHNNKHVTDRS